MYCHKSSVYRCKWSSLSSAMIVALCTAFHWLLGSVGRQGVSGTCLATIVEHICLRDQEQPFPRIGSKLSKFGREAA